MDEFSVLAGLFDRIRKLSYNNEIYIFYSFRENQMLIHNFLSGFISVSYDDNNDNNFEINISL